MEFNNIPELVFETIHISTKSGDNFASNLQAATNNIIGLQFPYVAVMSLKNIANELNKSLSAKIKTLEKLKKKYRKQNINVVQDIIIDDFEMYNNNNIKFFTESNTKFLESMNDKSLIQIIIKQFENNLRGKQVDEEILNVYKLLQTACNYQFTKLTFANESQTVLNDKTLYRIVQVWQVFNQYFKIFDYLDYLENYYSIKNKTNVNYVSTIIELFVKIGPITC